MLSRRQFDCTATVLAMDIASLIAFLSFGAASASAVFAGLQRADAKKSAERAENAEAAAVDAQRRAVESVESMAFIFGPPWSLSHVSGDAYILTNNSPYTALEVDLAHDATGGASIDGIQLPGDIGPKSAIKFMFSYSLGTGFQKNLDVSWKRTTDGEVQHWTHPIPPRG